MKAKIAIILIFVFILLAISLIPIAQASPYTVEIRITGTENLRFQGSIGDTQSSRSVEGRVPNSYFIKDPAGGIVSAVIQKMEERGTLTVTLLKDGAAVISETTTAAYGVVSVSHDFGACIIATATYGSELAPEVAFLRGFRDQTVLSTFAGSQFMIIFNQFYYSFSPQVATYISAHSMIREIMKLVLYPLIGILRLSALTYSVFNFNPELSIIMAGLIASSLIGIVYFTPLVVGSILLMKRLKIMPKTNPFKKLLVTLWFASIILLFLGEIAVLPMIMMIATAFFVVITLCISAFMTAMKVMPVE